MTQPCITFQNFSVRYRNTYALSNIHVSIPKHQITAIVGPSGCGKSTFLKSINRLLELDNHITTDGSIYFEGTDVATINPELLRHKIGMVFQMPSPFPMSIYKNLTYAPRYYGITSKSQLDIIVRDVLSTTGLYNEVQGDLSKSALALSGGQQQRLCIARALTAHPEVLLLDEPCSSLDVNNTKIIEDLLVSLKKDYTIVIVTHNLFQAQRIADNCIFLFNGQIIEQGPAQELFHNPKRKQTQDYLRGAF